MKPYIYSILLLCGLCSPLPAVAVEQPTPAGNLVYVIPIKDEIERGLVYVIRRGVNEAVQNNASVIIFDMDTPGGRIDSAQDIIDVIANTKIKTCTGSADRGADSSTAIIQLVINTCIGTIQAYVDTGATCTITTTTGNSIWIW